MRAKGALRRLAAAQLEPTPENYARAYALEGAVDGAADGAAVASALPERIAPLLAQLAQPLCDDVAQRNALVSALMQGRWPAALELISECTQAFDAFTNTLAQTLSRLVQGLDRPSQTWPAGRRRESVQRVLSSSSRDFKRLQQRLASLMSAWESDAPTEAGLGVLDSSAAPARAPSEPDTATAPTTALATVPTTAITSITSTPNTAWPAMATELNRTVAAALPPDDSSAQALAAQLALLGQRINSEGAHATLVAEVDDACTHARRFFDHRHRLVEELSALCRELGRGVTELAEEQSWARGQGEQLQARLAEGVNLRSVRAASEVLAQAREKHQTLRGERQTARDALRSMIQLMLQEMDGLGAQTDRFHAALGQHAQAVEQADTLEGLAEVVRDMVIESRAVQQIVGDTRVRLHDEHTRANELNERVAALEGDLRRLSDEATTDALTQVANRRGLAQAFNNELARMARAGAASASSLAPSLTLSLALLDIDNFKKLNDTLGHAAGDEALRKLAAGVRDRLRPGDHFARFGGEEFVIILPATVAAEAQEVLTRLQRSLTASLFMHGGQEVFVTFSAGVTAWREGETLESALDRADQGLYEAKRTGKNRCCLA